MHSRIDEYVANPRSHFGGPYEVVDSMDLEAADKRRILESWKLDAQQLADGTSENMTGGEETDLRDVSQALLQLEAFDPTLKPVDRVAGSAPGRNIKTPIPMSLAAPLGGFVGAGAGAMIAAAAAAPILLSVLQGAVIGVVAGGISSVFLRSSKA